MSDHNHGGSREGAGRPAQWGEPRISTSIRLTASVREFLADQEQSAGDYVEAMIRRSKAFRTWSKR